MPIEIPVSLATVSQAEFGVIAYEVTGLAFSLYKQLGRLFDESVYRRALANALQSRAIEELPIRLSHAGFAITLYLDLLVDQACPVELKVVCDLHGRHRGQLIQYLMLIGLNHGKLINFGPESVQHEFVNSFEDSVRRRNFKIDRSRWRATDPVARRFEEATISLLRDWGTGLDRSLYVRALTHMFGGEATVCMHVPASLNKSEIGSHRIECIESGCAFHATTLKGDVGKYERHLRKFLKNTSLERVMWVNIASGAVAFVDIERNEQ